MENIYNAIQNVYNMDKTTWQEVLAEMYNLVSKVENKFDLFENKFGSLLGEQVTIELKKMFDDGSLGSIFNDKLLKDINTKVDTIASKRNFTWKKIDNGYVTIIVDDYKDDLIEVFNLFKSKNIPISCAIPTIKLENDETKVELLKEISDNNGEILSHGYTSNPITVSTSIEDIEKEFNYSKQILERNGLSVNGYVRAGGIGSIAFTSNILKIFYKNYLYGFSSDEDDKLFSRIALTTFSDFKSHIDDAIANKKWVKFYFHDFSEISKVELTKMLDYILSSGIIPTTYSEMYSKFGVGNIDTERVVSKNDNINVYKYAKEIDDRTLFYESVNLIKNSSFTNFNADSKWIKDTLDIGSTMWWTTYDRGFYTAVRYNIPKELTGRFKLSQDIGKSRSNIGDIFRFGMVMQQQTDNNSVTLRIYKQYDNESSLNLVAEKTFKGKLSNKYISIDWIATQSLDIKNMKVEIEFNRPDTTSSNMGYFYLPKLTILTKEKYYQGITY